MELEAVNTASTYDFIAYDPVKTTLLESEAETEELTNHNAQLRFL